MTVVGAALAGISDSGCVCRLSHTICLLLSGAHCIFEHSQLRVEVSADPSRWQGSASENTAASGSVQLLGACSQGFNNCTIRGSEDTTKRWTPDGYRCAGAASIQVTCMLAKFGFSPLVGGADCLPCGCKTHEADHRCGRADRGGLQSGCCNTAPSCRQKATLAGRSWRTAHGRGEEKRFLLPSESHVWH